MKKILLAFDGSHFSEGAFEFARILNEKGNILLTGVFLPQVDYANLWSYSGGGMSGPLFVPLVEGENTAAVAENIKRFESACQRNGIEYRVHKDFDDFALPGLKKETRFADLLIIGSESFYKNLGAADSNEYLKEAMHGVECSVIVVPEKYDFPETNILAYDGSASSVYAIKQFSYLFPELAGNKTMLVYAHPEEANEIPDEVAIEELAARHFSDLSVTQLSIDPKLKFADWLKAQLTPIVICGAFGRSLFSHLFRKSFVTKLIADHQLPVFITHQ